MSLLAWLKPEQNPKTIDSKFRKTWSRDALQSPIADSIPIVKKMPSISVGQHPDRKKPTETSTTLNSSVPQDAEGAIAISKAQHRVLNLIMSRQSVFVTGAAGTGKSFVIKILKDVLDELSMKDKVAFTAPTGVAAANIQGLTIHSWSGLGVVSDRTKAFAQATSNASARKRWLDTEILVIDEISMLSAEMLDLLSDVGKRIRADERPFGGLQIIMCGDFFQLPPIGVGKRCNFCFESTSWREIVGTANAMVVLDKVFRQKDDRFLRLLNEMRTGSLSPKSIAICRMKVAEYQRASVPRQMESPAIECTKLFSTNVGVDEVNARELSKLSPLVNFEADDEFDGSRQNEYLQFCAGSKSVKNLSLAIGAQVMLIKNLDTSRGLVNGARGVVVGFQSARGVSGIFPQLPLVRFSSICKDEEDITQLILEEEFKNEHTGRDAVRRRQLPLMLAWAISIHKSQGMTISKLEVSFEGMFEYGQAYVALSRATDLDGLALKTFKESSIRAHPEVVKFYRDCLGYKCESEQKEDEIEYISRQSMRELFLASSVEAQRSTSSYRGAQEERWRTPLSGHRSAVTGPSCQKEADDWLAASDTEKEWLRPSGDIVVSGTKRKFQDPSVENTRAKPTRTSLQSDVPTIAKDCDKVACSITFAQQSPSSSDGVLVVPESHSSESHSSESHSSESHSSESHSSESQPSAPSHLSEDVKSRIERNRLEAIRRLEAVRRQASTSVEQYLNGLT